MAAEQELARVQGELAATQRVLAAVLEVVTPEQFSSVRTDLDLQDFLSRGTDSAV